MFRQSLRVQFRNNNSAQLVNYYHWPRYQGPRLMFFSKLCATEIPIRSWSGPGLLHWHNVHPDKISNASDIATCPSYILYEKKKNSIDWYSVPIFRRVTVLRVCLFRFPITFRIRAYFCEWPCQLGYKYRIINAHWHILSLALTLGAYFSSTDINWPCQPCGRLQLGSEQRRFRFSAILPVNYRWLGVGTWKARESRSIAITRTMYLLTIMWP